MRMRSCGTLRRATIVEWLELWHSFKGSSYGVPLKGFGVSTASTLKVVDTAGSRGLEHALRRAL